MVLQWLLPLIELLNWVPWSIMNNYIFGAYGLYSVTDLQKWFFWTTVACIRKFSCERVSTLIAHITLLCSYLTKCSWSNNWCYEPYSIILWLFNVNFFMKFTVYVLKWNEGLIQNPLFCLTGFCSVLYH